MVGYIATSYATIPLAEIEQQVSDYRTWYGITNIYFDEASSVANQLGYYMTASEAVRSADPGALVVLNPGDFPDPSYMSLGDVVVDFEGSYASFVNEQPPPWVYGFPSTMFASQVSGVPEDRVAAMLGLAVNHHSSYVYLTDETNSAVLYEQLPTYWSAELQDIQALCPSDNSAIPYRVVASDGGVFTFGDAQFYGSTGGMHLNQPIVGMAPTPTGHGYWLVASDGGVFTFGDAQFYGSTGEMHLNRPIVGMAPTPTGHGYWLVASDGGIFTFGDAQFYGSTGAMHLNRPIVGMAPTPTGHGYWLVASDGGIFTFGDAQFYGSTGGMHLNRPIVGMAPTPTGHGYWLVATDGGIFTFGDAQFYGSTGGMHLNRPIVGMAPTPTGHGYWLVATDGGIFSFGDAPFEGSTAAIDLTSPVVGMS